MRAFSLYFVGYKRQEVVNWLSFAKAVEVELGSAIFESSSMIDLVEYKGCPAFRLKIYVGNDNKTLIDDGYVFVNHNAISTTRLIGKEVTEDEDA